MKILICLKTCRNRQFRVNKFKVEMHLWVPARAWRRLRAGRGLGPRGALRHVAAGFGGAFYTTCMRPVCFMSDFGLADDFAGTCKGVMLRIVPGVSIVDLTHEVPGFGVEAGAEILQNATRYMPA